MYERLATTAEILLAVLTRNTYVILLHFILQNIEILKEPD